VSRAAPEAAELLAKGRDGEVRAVARLLSLVEDRSPLLRHLRLPPPRGATVGITGSPGVGKSTLVAAMVAAYRQAGARVGVLAVDPTSPFTGGAVLGDRVRMQQHATDPGVFIRSMATRGHLGGLAWATPQAARVLDAVGYDVVLVETVGVGQSEVEVAGLADTTLVVLAPGLGDGVQAAKAGILEVGDVFVVNKADRDGADQVVRDLSAMLAMAPSGQATWRPTVLRTVAAREEGVGALVDAVAAHRAWLAASGGLRAARVRRAQHEIEALALAALHDDVRRVSGGQGLLALAQAVADGQTTASAAADTLAQAARHSG
jgi:LAO/AO transport system kinase